jgi:ABC-type sugar transport system substrate-binding protein
VETGWKNIIEEVHKAGISLIVLNEELDDKYQCLFFGYDCKDEGEMAARWLMENIYNDTMDIKVAEITGYENSFSTRARREGFNEIIRDYSRINMAVSKNGYNTMSGGKRAMEEILAKAKVNVLFVHGEEMALGAVEVVKKRGLQPGKDIIVITVGSSDNILKAMQDGSFSCIIKRQNISNKLIINIINDLISNETIPKKVIIGNEVIF